MTSPSSAPASVPRQSVPAQEGEVSHVLTCPICRSECTSSTEYREPVVRKLCEPSPDPEREPGSRWRQYDPCGHVVDPSSTLHPDRLKEGDRIRLHMGEGKYVPAVVGMVYEPTPGRFDIQIRPPEPKP